MIDPANSIELDECLRYADRADGEQILSDWKLGDRPPAIVVSEGFEERALGVLQSLRNRQIRIPRILIGRYVNDAELNKAHRKRFEALAEELAPGAWDVIENHDDGVWVQEALSRVKEPCVALDITGLSNRGMFGALDALSNAPINPMIMYSEAAQYWPKLDDWKSIKKKLSPNYTNADELADLADESEWLYSGQNFHVDLIQGHEGYDVAGTSALVAFLPFKAARLAAVMNHAEYSQYLFIAGRPRLAENIWRLDALKQINCMVTKDWPVEEMYTFGYREALKQMAILLFSTGALSHRCDIHVAPMGSKLQNFACWALSRITRAVTVVISIPSRYFPTAYSEGIGESWIFPLTQPKIGEN